MHLIHYINHRPVITNQNIENVTWESNDPHHHHKRVSQFLNKEAASICATLPFAQGN